MVQGLRLDLCSQNRMGLLSDITRVFRENGLSISRIEVATQGEKAVGSIYVMDAAGHDVNQNTVELAIKEIGGSIIAIHKSPNWGSFQSTSPRTADNQVQDAPRFSLGSLLWSQLERISSTFGPIRL